MIAELRRSRAKISRIRIYFAGDIVEGEGIFDGQAHEVERNLLQQACKDGPEIMTEAVLMALANFDEVWVGSVPGNHGRGAPKGSGFSKATNWDTVCALNARAALLGNEASPRKDFAGRLAFHVSEDFYFIDRIWAWGNLVLHGDQIRGWASIPWYGAKHMSQGWVDAVEQPWDNLFFGHFHTPAMATIGHRRWYCNGTLESDNTFAAEKLAACGTPAQRLFFFDAEHGIISDDLIELVPREPTVTRFRSGDLDTIAKAHFEEVRNRK
jgi:hypothetical protein